MSPIRLTGAVMAHPRRLDAARSLIASAPPGFLTLVPDPDPDGPPTGLRTSIRAWSEVPAGSTHHLVLEDDARLSDGFREQAERAVAAMPDAAVVLFNAWNSRNGAAVRLGALAGVRWVAPADEYTANVALILPVGIAAGFPAYAREHGGTWPDDVILARYLRSVGASTYLAVPNLVEHGEFPSISGNDRHGLRMSACFAAPAPDARWRADDVLRPDAVPFFKYGLALCSVRRGDRWRTIGYERYSRLLGVDAEDCRKEFDAAPAVERLRADGAVADDALEAFWRTGYALGLLGARHGSRVDWREDPLVDRALDSLGPGGLCTDLGAAELRRLQVPLREAAGEALFAGARAPARSTSGRRVVFAGADSPLKRSLVDDLTDRGHRVRVSSEVGAVEPDEVVVEAVEDGIRVRGSVLRFGVPYGPGLVDGSPLNDLVLRSMTMQPMRVTGPVLGPYRFVHVWDIGNALEALVESPGPPGVVDLAVDPPVTLRQLAELIARVVRQVEIDLPDPGEPSPSGTGPSARLADGIRTVAQWLAYEAD
ncbi:hypothetical protein FHS29_000287 [Saccharothrix tamanrassetensis]|uniref:Uncharacterized protein n=1 Tax=Saccharothrix tamanrassetensis TaxID=1051531 RepID=A0A841CC11_9PSEU|nr:hypothetical protein [Saccharothrix tamanrassetensis]MBB5953717.1 hypothetical protein [Saccharothrix tamanrassetensis]